MAEASSNLSFSAIVLVMPPNASVFVIADMLHIRVLQAREDLIGPEWKFRITNTYWRYYVNSDDGCSVRLSDSSIHALPPNQLHFLPAHVTYETINKALKVPHLFAHFDLIGLPGKVSREIFPRPISLPMDAALKATSNAMRESLYAGHADGHPAPLFAVKAAIHAGLAVLFAQMDPDRAKRLSAVLRPTSPIAPALQYVEANLGKPIRVALLAKLCGYTEAHFTRLFHHEVGQTPAQFIMERRVAVAAQRLVLSSDTIDRIAEECGFPDRFYFSRVFTRLMKMPPAAFRKSEPMHRNQNKEP
jgi:AraC-like DNA-binding protein